MSFDQTARMIKSLKQRKQTSTEQEIRTPIGTEIFLPNLSGLNMRGVICMWAGTLASIPSGWQLCNGANGSPDLRVKFVRGAATGLGAGALGGCDTHTHVVSGSTAASSSTKTIECFSLNSSTVNTDSHTHTFSVTSGGGQPPAYYSVLFIQKL